MPKNDENFIRIYVTKKKKYKLSFLTPSSIIAIASLLARRDRLCAMRLACASRFFRITSTFSISLLWPVSPMVCPPT